MNSGTRGHDLCKDGVGCAAIIIVNHARPAEYKLYVLGGSNENFWRLKWNEIFPHWLSNGFTLLLKFQLSKI